MYIKDTFEIYSTNVGTNRETLDESDINETNRIKIYKMVEDFIETNNNKELSKYFDNLVQNFSDIWEDEIVCYRGVDKKYKASFVNNQISPTPKEYCVNNRYSRKQEQAFYLIDNPMFIKNEIRLDEWLEQKYKIDPKQYSLRLANVTSSNKKLHNDLKHIFKISETGISIINNRSFEEICALKHNNKYLISQFIADLFKKYDWDGLVIPGVHGSKDGNYNNIVIFGKALGNWNNWCDGELYLC